MTKTEAQAAIVTLLPRFAEIERRIDEAVTNGTFTKKLSRQLSVRIGLVDDASEEAFVRASDLAQYFEEVAK